jgi:hypothetical protein
LQSKKKCFKIEQVGLHVLIDKIKCDNMKAADAIAKRAPRLVLLSGTPALSRPMELFSQISIIEPTLFPSPIDFGMRYCDGKKVSFGIKEHYDFQASFSVQVATF